jgi:flavin reductase (DIM6/NTAB) family NADH-FMN oxidoreductase RutF
LGISVLSQEQEHWSRHFAERRPNKIGGLELATGACGVFLVPDAVVQLECRVVSTLAAGDHTIYLGEVLALAVTGGAPLVYHAAAYGRVAPLIERPRETGARAST